MTCNTQSHLYLCYAERDTAHALSIFSALNQDGYRVSAAIYPGSPPCASALGDCAGVIVLLSSALIEDAACCRLCAAAEDSLIPLLLVPLPDAPPSADLPFSLHTAAVLSSCEPSAVCDGVRRCEPMKNCRSQGMSEASANVIPSESRRESSPDHAATTVCSRCGASLRPDARFCYTCGTVTAASCTPSPSPPPPSPNAQTSAVTSNSCQDTASPALNQVHFSALAPKTLAKGDYSMIEVVMYEPSHRHVVQQMLAERDEPTQEARSGLMQVAEQTTVRVELFSPDLPLEDACEEGVWVGEYLNFSFPVLLPEDYSKKQMLFIATVYFNDVIATKLKFIVKCRTLFGQKIQVVREDVLSAFVSYASVDRARVTSMIQGMRVARPDMNIFLDVETLRSGQQWEETLYREIESRDVLFLCWSHNAKESEWVEREWRYALKTKGLQGIEPVPLEPAQLCPPPEELSSKHFNDTLLFYTDPL